MSHFGESKFNEKQSTIGRLFSIYILCQEMYPLMLKTQRGGKKQFLTLYARLFVYSALIQCSVPSQTWWCCQI